MSETLALPVKKKHNRKPAPTQFAQMLDAVTSMSLDKVVEFQTSLGKHLAEEKAKLEASLKLLEGCE